MTAVKSGAVCMVWVLCLVIAVGPVMAVTEPAVPELWFPVGEKLVYRIYWGFIPVGESTATTELVERDGRVLLAIRFRTKTNKVLSALYPVDDFIESLVDPVTFLPVQFTKKLSEGHYRCHEVTTFDHVAGVARMSREGRESVHEYKIKPDTRDIVSFMYYMRAKELEPDENYEYQVMADEQIYDVFVETGDVEDVKTVDGDRIPSLKMEPKAAFEGLFVRKGKMWLWVSRDDRRILTRMSAKVPVASIKLVLDEIHAPKQDAVELNSE